MEFVIKRSGWMRGSGLSQLREAGTGRMCCLGFFGRAVGLSETALEGRITPLGLRVAVPLEGQKWPAWMFDSDHWDPTSSAHSGITCELMHCNDDPHLSEASRESRLAGLFSRQGCVVRFEP